jgi:polysaccharide pyruvyl transferase WcaK-like protein
LSGTQSTAVIRKKPKIAFFGNFGTQNFGNEATLQAIHFNLRRLMPEAEFACICTFPANVSAANGIAAFPISPPAVVAWEPKAHAARLIRRVVIGIPNELYRWYYAFMKLGSTDALIVPGTGLLMDSHDLLSWGPYGLFKWSVLAKMRGCKLLFVSVGVGPLNGRLGRFFAKMALGLADFRSYRDVSSLEYLKSIGFDVGSDHVYPDLVFSLPTVLIPRKSKSRERRPVVGLGLMHHDGMYGDITHDDETYRRYMDVLLESTKWLLDRGYDVKLLIGELRDPVFEFTKLVNEKLPGLESTRILHTPVTSVEALLAQFADTDFVVVTRFHNIVFALLNDKPVVSISFHSKCASLMRDMGMPEYCLQIDHLERDQLIGKVLCVENNGREMSALIVNRKMDFRLSLDKQYLLIARLCGVQSIPV